MYIKKILQIIFLFFYSFTNAQDFKGVVIDETTQEPVSFAHIIVEGSGFGVISKIDGSFIIPFKFNEFDCTISSLGYNSRKLKINNDVFSSPINLKQKVSILEDVHVTAPKYKYKWLNDFNFPSSGLYGIWTGGEVSTYVHESEKFENALLKSTAIYIHNISVNNYLRLHIYNNDLKCSCPGVELLDTNYLIYGGVKNSWVNIDLRKSSVKIPENGIFISFEGLRTNSSVKKDTLELGGFSKSLNFGNHTFRKDFLGNWKPQQNPKDIDVTNVLNLAVKINIAYKKNKHSNQIEEIKYKSYSKREIKKIFGTRNVKSLIEYPNSSFSELINSVYNAIENNDIPYMVNNLFVFDEESVENVYEELLKRKAKGEWIPESEKKEILEDWNKILLNLNNAKFIKIDYDLYSVEFSNLKNKIIVKNDGNNWKIVAKYHSGLSK